MKVCFVGNSHLASLKLAVQDGLVSPGNIECVFWGSRGQWVLDRMFVEGGRLRAQPQVLKGIQRIAGEGYPEIDPRDFSVVFFHAASLPTFELVFSLAGHGGFLSDAFVGRMSERWLEERQAYRLAAELKKAHSGARISLIAQPYPRDGADEFGGISASDELREKVNARLKKAANAAGLDLIFQPAETVIRGCYTMKQYATNSVRLTGRMDVKHPSDESFHMNSQFGAEMLRLILPDLPAVSA